MHLSKLITALQSLDETRFKSLDDYIHSPFFKVPLHAANLFDYLKPMHPRFPERKVNIDLIASFAQNLSTASKQARAGSELLEIVEEFMAYEDWSKNKRGKAFNQLHAFKEFQLSAQFLKGYEKEMEQLEKCPEQDVDTFLHKHLFTELSFNGFDALVNRVTQTNIMPVVETLDQFYAIKKLRYLCEALNRRIVFGNTFHDSQIPALLKILEPYTNDRYPYIYLFVNVYRMMEEATYEESDLYYQFIKQYVASQNYDSPPASVTESSTYAINNCLNWYNKGYEAAGNEYLWWIEWKMKYNLLLKNGKLLPIVFRNLITIATMNKKSAEWIDIAIKRYGPCLPEDQYETYIAFARGLYNYSLKNHKEATRFFLLAQAKEDVIFNSIIRRWQWMSLYECDPYDTDTLLNHLLSFEKYLLRNKKEAQPAIKVFSLFIDFAAKLVKANRTECDTILNELHSQEYFSGSSWLAEQISKKGSSVRRTTLQIPHN